MALPSGVQTSIIALLIAYPSVALVHRSGASATLHIVALAGLLWMGRDACRPSGRVALFGFLKDHRWLCVAMFSPLVVNVVSHAYSGNLAESFSTTVQRAAFSIFALYLLLQFQRARLVHVQWGLLTGVLVGASTLFFLSNGGVVRPAPTVQNLLNYANFLALLGFFALCMLGWQLTRFKRVEAFLKMVAVALVVYALWLAESRGPWLSLVALMAFFFLFGLRAVAFPWRVATFVIALAVLVITLMQSERLAGRLYQSAEAVHQSVPALLEGQQPKGGDASTRIRLGLWHASWLMFKQHPWVGDASRSFSERLAQLYAAGLVAGETTWRSDDAGAFVQSHNEVMHAMATRGVAGLVSLFLLYGVPLHYFWRHRVHTDAVGRVAAGMGIATCVGVMLFGLTVTVFTSGWMMAHYALLIALFIALSKPVQPDDDADLRHLTSDGKVPFPPRWQQKYLRRFVRFVRGPAHRHNAHLWPYLKIARATAGHISAMSVQGYRVPLISLREAFADAGEDLHIILSGPSVGDIDYSQLPKFVAMGVNGSIVLQDTFDVHFPFYCLIDRAFVRERPDVVRRIVAEERVLFASPDVVRHIYEYIPIRLVRCKICLVEEIAERAYEPKATPESLQALVERGYDLHIFDHHVPLGFSFDQTVGWFDADTVAYTALQVAVWGGMKSLYFHGLDITGGTTRRFYDEGMFPLRSRLGKNLAAVIEPSFRQAIPQLQRRGIRVFSLSPHSALGPDVIPYVGWQSLRV